MKRNDLANALLHWYAGNARVLPWRGAQDPYATWVSEIMLQQTRVETVISFYERWMQRFPDIETLAEAAERDILSAWEGLGYYRRARNLHKAAQIVVSELDGRLPQNVAGLRKLPGIGRYTAGAIASIAFGQDEPVLDGNIRRVLSRLFNVTDPADSVQGQHRLWELAAKYLPSGRAGDYNQALMDLGAMICTPQSPQCEHCPLKVFCAAYRLGAQEQLPVKKPRTRTPHYLVTAAVICQNQHVLIAQRPTDGLLGGLWEFPGGKVQPGEELTDCLKREICEELGVAVRVGEPLGEYQHAYTHFRVTLYAFHCKLVNGGQPKALQAEELQWVELSQLSEFPMGKIDRLISRDLLAAGVLTC